MTHNYPLGKELREQFPIFTNNILKNNRLVYLDSAATAQKPKEVIDAMVHFMENDYGPVHRGSYGLSARSSEAYERVRLLVANHIGPSVKPEQIIFTKGATEGLNILARGLGELFVRELNRIVLTVSEHHANFVPWQQLALQKNCEIAYIPLEGKLGENINISVEKAEKLITKNTKIVTLATTGNVLGQISPIKEIIAIAKNVGSKIILDCAQSATYFEDDYFAMGADALVFSGHKIYGPSGIGILALSPEMLDTLPPFLFGGGMISTVTTHESQWAEGPARFEAGTPPVTEVVGLGAAIQWISNIGAKRIYEHVCKITTCFHENLKNLPFIEIFSSQTGQESLVSFHHKNIHAHDLVTLLDSKNICMRAGHHCAWPLIKSLKVDAIVRASFAAYSDEDDIKTTIEFLKEHWKL